MQDVTIVEPSQSLTEAHMAPILGNCCSSGERDSKKCQRQVQGPGEELCGRSSPGMGQTLGFVLDGSAKHEVLIMNGVEQLSMFSLSLNIGVLTSFFLVSRSPLLIWDLSCQHLPGFSFAI